MLESASGSLTSYPGHPPAAYGGLVSLVPDLNSWPSEGARLRRAAVAWSKRYDPLLRHEVKVSMDWTASAIKPGRRSLNRTSMGVRRARGAIKDPSHTKSGDVLSRLSAPRVF